jgi:ABC-type Mn2+/Zn2+ transport system permease subunit
MEQKPRKKFNWLLVLIYLLLAGGLIGLIVFLVEEIYVDVALAISLLFGLLGGIAYSFHLNKEGIIWLILTILEWIGALIALTVYVVEENILHESLAIAMLFFIAAGLLIYTVYRRGDADSRSINEGIRWRKLGVSDEPEWEREREENPAERDVPQYHAG